MFATPIFIILGSRRPGTYIYWWVKKGNFSFAVHTWCRLCCLKIRYYCVFQCLRHENKSTLGFTSLAFLLFKSLASVQPIQNNHGLFKHSVGTKLELNQILPQTRESRYWMLLDVFNALIMISFCSFWSYELGIVWFFSFWHPMNGFMSHLKLCI